MELNINVKIDVSEKLEALVKAVLEPLKTIGNHSSEQRREQPSEEPKAEPREDQKAEPEKQKAEPQEEQKAEPQEEPKAEPQEEPKAEPQEEQKAEPQKPAVKYDGDYARGAVRKVRDRIEGKDWEGKTTSPGYQKYHKMVTRMCRGIAEQISGGKTNSPTELEPEQIEKFAMLCEEIHIGANGELIEKLPF